MAVERVERQLREFTSALDAAGVPYAVIGGNAVAAWVSSIDPNATRNTKDVDVLLRRDDWERAAKAVDSIGLMPEEVNGVPMFMERNDPTPKRAVHVIFADEPVRSHDRIPAPSVSASMRSAQGYQVINLPELVRMKLQAFRLRDQTHLVDLMHIGLIDASWKEQLPAELQDRYQQVLEAFEREGPQP